MVYAFQAHFCADLIRLLKACVYSEEFNGFFGVAMFDLPHGAPCLMRERSRVLGMQH